MSIEGTQIKVADQNQAAVDIVEFIIKPQASSDIIVRPRLTVQSTPINTSILKLSVPNHLITGLGSTLNLSNNQLAHIGPSEH